MGVIMKREKIQTRVDQHIFQIIQQKADEAEQSVSEYVRDLLTIHANPDDMSFLSSAQTPEFKHKVIEAFGILFTIGEHMPKDQKLGAIEIGRELKEMAGIK